MKLRNAALSSLADMALEGYQTAPSAELAEILQEVLTTARRRGLNGVVDRVTSALLAGPVAIGRVVPGAMPARRAE